MSDLNQAVGAPLETPVRHHTPGPWYVSVSGPTVYALHGSPARNRFSATVQAGRADDAQLPELLANARLCAAAPYMLESLQEVLAYFDAPEDGCFSDEALKRLRGVVALAVL
jgi:hypothetical protein